MLQVDGVIDAYFEDQIEVLVVEESPQHLERIEAILAKHEIASSGAASAAP